MHNIIIYYENSEWLIKTFICVNNIGNNEETRINLPPNGLIRLLFTKKRVLKQFK